MTTKTILSSGNIFYFVEETSNKVAYGFFVTPSLTFLGGVLCKEATRKLKTFSELGCRMEVVAAHPEFSELNLVPFAQKLGSASTYFMRAMDLWISDYHDCSGTSSSAASCSDRSRYYDAVGMSGVYGTMKKFPVMLFIANHVAMFSVQHFRETFFSGYVGEYEADNVIYDRSVTRYNKYNLFKAPAYYVRSVVNSLA